MMSFDLDRLSLRTIRWTIFAAFTFTPFLFSAHQSELFELPKMAFLYLCGTIVGSTWIIRMIHHGRLLFPPMKIAFPFLGIILATGITTLASLDPHMSLYGYYSRFHGGFFSIVTYVVLAGATATFFNQTHLRRLIIGIVASTAFVSLWGVGSKFGLDPSCAILTRRIFEILQRGGETCWAANFNPADRIFATIGQANWLAGYLVMVLPFTLWGIVVLRGWKRFASIVVLLLFLLTIFFTQSRGGFAAGLVAVVIFGLLLRWKITVLVLTPILPTLFIFRDILLQRMDTIIIRLSVWSAALDIFRTHPIFGTGPETFALAFDAVRPLSHLTTPEWDFLYNKAHNEVLNIASTMGLIGLAAYGFFVGWIFFTILKHLSDTSLNRLFGPSTGLRTFGPSTPLGTFGITILSSLGGSLIQAFFGFSITVQALIFFHLPVFFYLSTNHSFDMAPTTQPVFNWRHRAAIVAIVMIGLALTGKVFLFLYADSLFAEGKKAAISGNLQQTLTSYERAAALQPNEPVYLDEYTYATALAAASIRDLELAMAWEKRSLDAWRRVISTRPNDSRTWKTGMQMFEQLSRNNPEYLEDAIASGRRAEKLSPNDLKIKLALAELYMQKNAIGAARTLAAQAHELKPDYPEATIMTQLFDQLLSPSPTPLPPVVE
ncbi:MAG: O-antigen ligase family protein [bacterium]|nr:O-antigen ligase family protein [bacterium]